MIDRTPVIPIVIILFLYSQHKMLKRQRKKEFKHVHFFTNFQIIYQIKKLRFFWNRYRHRHLDIGTDYNYKFQDEKCLL